MILNKKTHGIPEGAMYIGRPTKWGNPFTHVKDRNTLAKHLVATRGLAVQEYRRWIMEPEQTDLRQQARKELRGKDLVCWCSPLACHGDVLDAVAKSQDDNQLKTLWGTL